jgi:hypothetical protein
MDRRKNNKGSEQTQFKTKHAKPRLEVLTVRVPEDLKAKLKSLDNPADIINEALEKLVSDL